ncbi:hypothetical protein A2_00370 [Pseudomonas phage BIM BV-45]|nr:hypothetical protein A2_00370 [Pseudomonas phage BIM BV-45]
MATSLGQVIGGGQQRYQAVQAPAPQKDSTSELLFKMAQPILQQKLAQEQQAKFVEGMQRVAVGEAYKDIKGEDSFLSNIFGPSASVTGAAAMAKVKSVDDFNTQMYQDMQGMASMSPEQFREHAVKGMQQHLTGDADVDNVIQSKMVESLGPLMKTQAKANYAWQQQQTTNSFNGMMQAAGDKFHGIAQQFAQGLMNKDDFEQAKASLILSSQPLEGMNPETYKKAIMDSAALAMNKGNMWVDRVFQQTGMYDGLDVDDQTKMIKARDAAAAKVKNEYGFNKYGAAIGELMGGAAGRSPAQNHDMANAINQRYMDETGSETGLLNMKDVISMDRSTYSRMFKMQDKVKELSIKAQMDAKAEGQLAMQAVELVQGGKGNYAVGMGIPRNKVDVAFNEGFTSKLASGKTEDALDMASTNYSHGNAYVNPQFQGMLLEPFRQITTGGVPGPEFDRTMQFLDAWAQRPESGGAIDAYLGSENVVKLQRYRDSLIAFQGDKQQAAKAAWGTPVVAGPKLSSVDNKPLMMDAIRQKIEGKGVMNKIDRWWKNVPGMSDAAKDVVFNAVAQDAQTYVNNLGMAPQAAIMRAMEGAGRQSVDTVGAYAIPKEPNQLPLAALVGTDDQTMARVFPKFLQSMARKQGVAVNLTGGGSNVTSKKGEATPWTNVTDLTNWYGGGDADVSLMRSRDVTDKDGNVYGVYSGLLFRDDKTATVNFTSKDLKEFYENTIRNRNDVTDSLRKAGL